MKRFCLIMFLCVFSAGFCEAIPRSNLIGYGQTAVKVRDLPANYNIIKETTGRKMHADLGVKFNQISLLGIPLWNYGEPQYVVFGERDLSLFKTDIVCDEISSEEVYAFQQRFPDLPSVPQIPFWHKFGGKLVVLAICIVCVLFNDMSDKT